MTADFRGTPIVGKMVCVSNCLSHVMCTSLIKAIMPGVGGGEVEGLAAAHCFQSLSSHMFSHTREPHFFRTDLHTEQSMYTAWQG